MKNENNSETPKKDEKANLLKDFFIPFILVCGIFSIVFTKFPITIVEGESMYPTYKNGQKLLCCKVTANEKYNRNDIIVADTDDNLRIIKRVIAKEGDKLFIDFDKNEIYINDIKIDEPYLNEPDFSNADGFNYPLIIEENKLFVMGDNRNHSEDSRNKYVGLIDVSNVKSKVLFTKKYE